MFPYKAAIFRLVAQSLALPSELPEHCTGIFYFIHCGLSRNYSTTIEALPQIVGDIGLEPNNLSAKNSRVANYTNLQNYLIFNKNIIICEKFMIIIFD